MVGDAAHGQLTAGVRVPVGALRYALARDADEPTLRRLAREQSMPGWVNLGFEREPNFFHAADTEGDRHRALLAIERDTERVIAMHTRAVRDVFVDGRVQRLGYLGQLRTDPRIPTGRWRLRLLRGGFEAGREQLRSDGELRYELTAIVADNHHARRILEAGLDGLPRYLPISAWSTLAFATTLRVTTSRRFRVRTATHEDWPSIVSLLNRYNARFQCAPTWRQQDLDNGPRCRGLSIHDFLVAERGGQPVGCAALWDQRGFKQMIVRGYRTPLNRLRPAFNHVAPWLALPRLPAVGSALAQAWLSHFAHCDEDLELAAALVGGGIRRARERGLDHVMLGLSDAHPACRALTRRLRVLRYRSILYLVHWDDERVSLPDLTRRLVHVETAAI